MLAANFLRLGLSLLALGLVLAFPSRPSAADAEKFIALFDPDANHQAILNISTLFNQYLKSANLPLKFQPVHSAAKLEELIKTGQVEYAIVASSYVKERGSTLKPLLVPEAGGDVYYRKLLMTKEQDDTPNFAGKNIAATLSDSTDKGASVLKMLRRGGVRVDGSFVIPVARDIDALLALSFGSVQAALVTPSSVDVLRRINPAAAEAMVTTYKTEPILRSPFCLVAGKGTNEQQTISIIKDMVKDEGGRRAMSSLGFERWVAYQPSMMRAP